ncbi:MAG: penicillin-binding transpeptidase domain-containing protein [Phycisphaerae bacterium]
MYKRRLKIFLILVAVVLLGLTARLAQLQLLHGEQYRRQAEELLQSIRLLPAARGTIFDRRGRVLAMDRRSDNFCLDYRFITEDRRWQSNQQRRIARQRQVDMETAAEIYNRRAERTWRAARDLAEANGEDLDETLDRIVGRVRRIREIVGQPVEEQQQVHPVVTGLDEGTAVALKARLDEMVGASVLPGHTRFYPYGPTACHIIGLTGPVTTETQQRLNGQYEQEDWETRLRESYHDDSTYGIAGVEKMCEDILRGRRGYRQIKRVNRSERLLHEVSPEPGSAVHLTIDIELQRELTDLLVKRGHTGSIVVLSVPTGELLAAVSVPTYDLNRYRRDYEELTSDNVFMPLQHRAVGGMYPPGSTVKPVSALAGLHHGVVSLSETITCRGRYGSDGPACWYRQGHGPLAVVDAIKHSCNVYFYEVGDRLGMGDLAHTFAQLGYGRKLGTGLPEERAGLVATPRWVSEHGNRRVRRSDAWFVAIGQGLITATPLHVANAMATIARDGRFLSPMISLEGGPPRVRRQVDIDESYFRAVRRGMRKVVADPGGTAYRVFTDAPELRDMCGKTGTAQAPAVKVDGQVMRSGDMAWFAGFAPADNPEIAFSVVVEYADDGGSRVAGPVAVDLLKILNSGRYDHLK